MGKKKKEDSISKNNKYLDFLMPASLILEEEYNVVPISPAFDLAVGGIPEGTWCIFSGKEKAGKSSLALQIARNAQHLFGKKIFYSDVEGRFRDQHILSIGGLDPAKVEVFRSKKGHILTAEEHLTFQRDAINDNEGGIHIIDSVSALCPKDEMEGDITAKRRSDVPKLMATFCRSLGQKIPIQKSIIILISQLMSNTSGFGSPWMEDGGNKIKFQQSLQLRAQSKSMWPGEEPKGQTVFWKVYASALNSPGRTITSQLRYGYGYDKYVELHTLAEELGLISTKAGGWISSDFFEEKIQGIDNFVEFLKDNPTIYDIIWNYMYENFGIKRPKLQLEY